MAEELASVPSSETPSIETPAMPPSGEVAESVAADAAPAVPETQSPESVSSDAPAIPPEVLARAQSYGLDPSTIQGLAPEVADQFVKNFALAFDQRIAALGREPSPAQPPPPVSAAQQPQPAAGKQEAQPSSPEDFNITLPDDFDEDVKKAFGSASSEIKEHKKALTQLAGMVQQMYQHFEGARKEAAVATFDQLCSNVPEDVKPLIGSGRSLEMKEGTAERKFREDLLAQMDALDIGYRKQGVRLEEGEVFKRALNILAAPHVPKLERERLQKELESGKRKALHNPRTNAQKTPAGQTVQEAEAESLAEVQRLMLEHGLADKASLNVFSAMA